MESEPFEGPSTQTVGSPQGWKAAYLGAQAVLTAAWWGLLWRFPDSIRFFRNDAVPDAAILDLWLADGVLVVCGSGLASFLVARGHPAARPVLWVLCGALGYATLLSLGGSLRSGGGWLAVALMGPATLLTFLCVAGKRT